MNKELNDLQDIKNAFISHCKELDCDENYIKVCENKFSKIEKALKDYEKKDKALEIIREKEVNVFDILATNCADYYNMSVNIRISPRYCSSYFLTQEEYDLLKEVLL